jgi:RimJ/RimL family protein N-acetyltransferase
MELETRRLLLRPLRDDDAPAMARALNNYEVVKNLSRVPFPYTLEDAAQFIDLQKGFDARSRVFAIAFRAAPDELIGVIAYEFEVGDAHAEFGYWLHEACWGMGLMSEAAAALVGHAFGEGGVEELRAGYWNPVSGRLLRRLGFEETSRMPIFSSAQNREVPAVKLRLSRLMWLERHNRETFFTSSSPLAGEMACEA